MGKKVEEVQAQEVEATEQEKKVAAELMIKVFEDGDIEVNTPEGARELTPVEIENITRNVAEQLRDMRIAQTALEMFKAKLG